MGLIVARGEGESIRIVFDEGMTAAELEELIEQGITVTVHELKRGQTRLRIKAPSAAKLYRAELLGEPEGVALL